MYAIGIAYLTYDYFATFRIEIVKMKTQKDILNEAD